MKKGQRQIIAGQISATVRILELLGFEYEVKPPRNKREKGNKSPRVVYVDVGEAKPLRVYNDARGNTWANEPDGTPIAGVGSTEHLYEYLAKVRSPTKRKPTPE